VYLKKVSLNKPESVKKNISLSTFLSQILCSQVVP